MLPTSAQEELGGGAPALRATALQEAGRSR